MWSAGFYGRLGSLSKLFYYYQSIYQRSCCRPVFAHLVRLFNNHECLSPSKVDFMDDETRKTLAAAREAQDKRREEKKSQIEAQKRAEQEEQSKIVAKKAELRSGISLAINEIENEKLPEFRSDMTALPFYPTGDKVGIGYSLTLKTNGKVVIRNHMERKYSDVAIEDIDDMDILEALTPEKFDEFSRVLAQNAQNPANLAN